MYKPLEEPCKSCLGCQRLENPNFTGDKNCRWNKQLEQIKLNLGDKK